MTNDLFIKILLDSPSDSLFNIEDIKYLNENKCILWKTLTLSFFYSKKNIILKHLNLTFSVSRHGAQWHQHANHEDSLHSTCHSGPGHVHCRCLQHWNRRGHSISVPGDPAWSQCAEDRPRLPGDVPVQRAGHPRARLDVWRHTLPLGRVSGRIRPHDHVLRLHWSCSIPCILLTQLYNCL